MEPMVLTEMMVLWKVSQDVDGDINGDGGAITFSASSNTLDFADSVKANFGNSDDLQIYHDGTHSYINDAGTGNLKVGLQLW